MNQPDNAPRGAPATYPDEFFLKTLLRWYIGLIIHPSPTIREIVKRRPLLAGVGTAFGGSAISIVAFGAAYQLFKYQSLSINQWNSGAVYISGGEIILLGAFIVSAFAFWSLNLHCIAERFGDYGSFLRTFSTMLVISAVGYAICSGGILTASLIINPGGSGIFKDSLHTATNVALALTVVGLLWVSSLTAIVIKENYDLRIGKAALTVALSILPTFVIGYGLLFLLFLVALISGFISFG